MPSPGLGHSSGPGPQKSSPWLGQNLATGHPVRVKPLGSLVSEPEPQKLGSWGGQKKKNNSKKTTPRGSSGPKPRNWSASSSKTLAFVESGYSEWKPGAKFLATESTARVKTLRFALLFSSQDQKTLPIAWVQVGGKNPGLTCPLSFSFFQRPRWGGEGIF